MSPAGKQRSPARKALGAFALALPFLLVLVIALVAAELRLRSTTNLPFLSRSRCFTQDKLESPGFLPGCAETMRTPAGGVDFHTNELGFRDRPLSFFQGGAIALLGDSYVEGFWLKEEEGLARVLERKASWPYPLLNLGIRATGPSQQAIRLFRAWKGVPLKGVVWFLNPSDPLDELLFHARNPGLEINRERWSELNPSWSFSAAYRAFTSWSISFGDRVYLLLYVADKWIKQGSQARLVEGVEFAADPHCRSLSLAAAELKKEKLPLLFVAIPHGQQGARRPYLGLSIDDRQFEALLACARGTGASVLDLRAVLDGQPGWYWKNDWHFNGEGVEAAMAIAAPRIRAAWGGKP